MSIFKKKSFSVSVAIGEGAALVLTALLLLPMAMLIHRQVLGQNAGWLCAAAAAGISVFISTAVIARARGRQALATGGSIALGYALLAALLCALSGSGAGFGMWLVWLSAAVTVGALGGVLLSARRNTRRRKRR